MNLKQKIHSFQKGFTLLELSIVIVIIGLIVAGISAGQSLVAQGQLRAVVSASQQYHQLLNSFKLQYDQLPGDMNNAFDYWDTNCAASAALCNGDGNGLYDGANFTEGFRAWQHLYLAGMLPAVMTGVGGPQATNTEHIIGENVPDIGSRGAGAAISHQIFWGSYPSAVNAILYGRYNDVSNSLNHRPFLVPYEAKSLDEKMDDGMPNTGSIGAYSTINYSGLTSCKGGTAVVHDYTLSTTTETCFLIDLLMYQ